MSTESTHLKKIPPAGDSNTTNELVIGKGNIYQRSFLIMTSSLLVLLALVAVRGKWGGQHSKFSAHEFEKGASVLAGYQATTANSALIKDIFGIGAVSEIQDGCVSPLPCPWGDICPCGKSGCCNNCHGCCKNCHKQHCSCCIPGPSCVAECYRCNGCDLCPQKPACSWHSKCVGLLGDCCPTSSGEHLSCCDHKYA